MSNTNLKKAFMAVAAATTLAISSGCANNAGYEVKQGMVNGEMTGMTYKGQAVTGEQGGEVSMAVIYKGNDPLSSSTVNHFAQAVEIKDGKLSDMPVTGAITERKAPVDRVIDPLKKVAEIGTNVAVSIAVLKDAESYKTEANAYKRNVDEQAKLTGAKKANINADTALKNEQSATQNVTRDNIRSDTALKNEQAATQNDVRQNLAEDTRLKASQQQVNAANIQYTAEKTRSEAIGQQKTAAEIRNVEQNTQLQAAQIRNTEQNTQLQAAQIGTEATKQQLGAIHVQESASRIQLNSAKTGLIQSRTPQPRP
ncbi:MAG: hypothetical protein FWF24_06430 [Alphaproteobacteria bacterium]|nr:hypothetical protein [Alphaproteobacteria bacterium]